MRAEDILTMLVERFHVDVFIPFANLIMVLIDRPFGRNFAADAAEDRAWIDRVQAIDEAAMREGNIKPTQMVACFSIQTQPVAKASVLTDPFMTPEFWIRRT